METQNFGEVSLNLNGNVALVEFSRPPHNYFDYALIRDLGDAFEAAEREGARAIVLASEGKSFCAGAAFSGDEGASAGAGPNLYQESLRLFAGKLPVVAAIQGAAIGGGLGLALVADFRVVAAEARFAGNFVKIGIHPGFGLTHTLPRLVGIQTAALMLYTGRRVSGAEAVAMGLADRLVHLENLRSEAMALAAEFAESAPLAVQATRETLRAGLVEAVDRQQTHERSHQLRLMQTEDYKEGVAAVGERRAGKWVGQ
ncbi:MAG: enoyl-CoA hydratase/isomerase family protein [Pseudomonadota bacterium]